MNFLPRKIMILVLQVHYSVIKTHYMILVQCTYRIAGFSRKPHIKLCDT